MLPPSYLRSHFDAEAGCNRIVTLVGKADGALPIPQDLRVSRLVSDCSAIHTYAALSNTHGVYTFVLDGEMTCEGTTLGRRDSKKAYGASSG